MKINLKSAAIFILLLVFILPKKTNADCQFTCGPISIDTVNHQVCMGFQNNCSCIVTSYFWDYGNGLTGNGQIGGTCFSYPGTYTVKVFGTCSNGSMDSSIHTVLVDYPNNIICNFITSDNSLEQFIDEFSVSPNPTNGHLTIDLPNLSALTEVVITNTYGQEVNRIKCSNTFKLEMEIKGESGIYFVRVFSGDKASVFRIVKL